MGLGSTWIIQKNLPISTPFNFICRVFLPCKVIFTGSTDRDVDIFGALWVEGGIIQPVAAAGFMQHLLSVEFGAVESPARILCYVSLGTEHMCSFSEPQFCHWGNRVNHGSSLMQLLGRFYQSALYEKSAEPILFPFSFYLCSNHPERNFKHRAAEQLPTMRVLSYGVNCFHLSARIEAL